MSSNNCASTFLIQYLDYFWGCNCLPLKVEEVIPYFKEETDLYKGNQCSNYFIPMTGASTITSSFITTAGTVYYPTGTNSCTTGTSYTFTTRYRKVDLPPVNVKGCSFEGEVDGCIEFEE